MRKDRFLLNSCLNCVFEQLKIKSNSCIEWRIETTKQKYWPMISDKERLFIARRRHAVLHFPSKRMADFNRKYMQLHCWFQRARNNTTNHKAPFAAVASTISFESTLSNSIFSYQFYSVYANGTKTEQIAQIPELPEFQWAIDNLAFFKPIITFNYG